MTKTRLNVYEVRKDYRRSPLGHKTDYIVTDMSEDDIWEQETKRNKGRCVSTKKIGTLSLSVDLEKRLTEIHGTKVEILIGGFSELRELFKIYGRYLK